MRLQIGFIGLLVIGITRAALAGDDPYADVLSEFGIACDAEGVTGFLRSLHPSDETRKLVADLIAQLGDEDYQVRQRSSHRLQLMPLIPSDELKRAAQGDDPEVRWRAKEIMDHAGGKYATVLHAALRTIERRKLGGATAEVLRAIELCNEEYLLRAAGDALKVTAGPDDAERLRAAIGHDNIDVRIAAIGALGSVLGEKAAGDLRPLLKRAEDQARETLVNCRIRLAACRALADQGDRGCLSTLLELLDSDDVSVRTQSARILQALTGQQIPFTAYDDAAARQKSIDQWRDWLDREGPTAKLQFPLHERAFELGRTLICFHNQNKILELGDGDKQIWSVQSVMTPWACQGLANGHRLVASYNSRLVVEFDETGQEVWRRAGLPGQPFSVQRLENGNTLLALSDAQKAVEVDRDGRIVWEILTAGRPMDARRLPDGNTLVALQSANRVVEFDRRGQEVWKVEGLVNPLSASRLDSGHTLICETGSGRVVERDRGGKIVWSQTGLNSPYDAQRLPNGNTLISHNQGIIEIDPSGKTVWQHSGAGASRICRY